MNVDIDPKLMELFNDHKSNYLSQLSAKNVPFKWSYDAIIHQLTNWDNMTPTERKPIRSDYHNNKIKYLVKTFNKNTKKKKQILYRHSDHKTEERRVLHREEIFEMIANYHYEGRAHPRSRAMWTALNPMYANLSENTLKLFVDTCPTCQQIPEKKPKHVGATKPIISNHFRDRMQVDLIDYSSDPQNDQNDVEMKWLMVVKDHFTKLVYLRALPSKHAENVARELDHLFGFIGYPLTFHTDNGTEFSTEVINLVKEWNPSCMTVTGRPRTPRHQGSVENVNKQVKKALSNLGENDRNRRKAPNWVYNLGKAMATVNNHSSGGSNATVPYDHVFCMKFDDPFTFPADLMRECNTVQDLLEVANDNPQLKQKFSSLDFEVVPSKQNVQQPRHIRPITDPNSNKEFLYCQEIKDQHNSSKLPGKHEDFVPKKQRKSLLMVDSAFLKKPQKLQHDAKEFNCVFPELQCNDCKKLQPSTIITYAERECYKHMQIQGVWWKSDIIASFGKLLYHSLHDTTTLFVDCNCPVTGSFPLIVKIDNKCQKLVAVAHSHHHFVCIKVDLQEKNVVVFDGIGDGMLSTWDNHIKYVLKSRGIEKTSQFKVRYHNKNDFGGSILKQSDGHNCGPIACMVLWHTFFPKEVNTTWPIMEYRLRVVTKMIDLLESAKTSGDLQVCVRDKNRLETKDGRIVLSSSDDDDNDDLWKNHVPLSGKEKLIATDISPANIPPKDDRLLLNSDDESDDEKLLQSCPLFVTGQNKVVPSDNTSQDNVIAKGDGVVRNTSFQQNKQYGDDGDTALVTLLSNNKDGSREGMADGVLDGTAVGTEDGAVNGTADGSKEGWVDGALLGSVDGSADNGDDVDEDQFAGSHIIVTQRDELMLIDSSQAKLPPNNDGRLLDVDNSGIQEKRVKLDEDSTVLSKVHEDIVEDDTNVVTVGLVSPNHSQIITGEDSVISHSWNQKVEKRIESDMMRRKRQDHQAEIMKNRHKIGKQVKKGHVVNLTVDRRDRNSTIPRGILGIVANVLPTTGNCAIYCVHGLLGTRSKSIVYYDSDNYSIVKKPTLDDELKKVKEMVMSENFDVKEEKHKIVTPAKAHQLIYPTNEHRVGRGKCNCGCSTSKSHKSKKKVIHCTKRCGCIRNNRKCSSACSCSKDCPNRE